MPTMTPYFRKVALTAHITFSVGWLGSVAAYLALAIAGVTGQDAQMVRSAYVAMELTGWFVIVPLSVASLLTGLVQSLGTDWGLFRHYWILVKFVMTLGATTILLLHMPSVGRMSGARAEVIHAGGGLLVLLAATILSVFKPWGRTAYGRRMQQRPARVVAAHVAAMNSTTGNELNAHGEEPNANAATDVTSGTPWGLYVLVATMVLAILLVALHLSHGGHAGH